MGVSEIIAQIDWEIAKLQQARVMLGGGTHAKPTKAAAAAKRLVAIKRKRNISPEGRKRISEAVKRRWAEQKKASSAK